MVGRQTTLGEQLFDIAERERVPKIPADCAENQFRRSLPPLEDRRSSYMLHFSSAYQPPACQTCNTSNETVQFLERHGYWMVIGAVLGRQACLPIPANLILVAAGALAHCSKLSLSGSVVLSVVTFLIADLAWYEAGRKWGDRILHLGCGLSGDTSSCVHRANGIFSKYGLRTLLVSKFVPGCTRWLLRWRAMPARLR